MDRAELAAMVGPLLTMAGREALRPFVNRSQFCITVRYDQVKNWPGMERVIATDGVEMGDGQEWMQLWLESERS